MFGRTGPPTLGGPPKNQKCCNQVRFAIGLQCSKMREVEGRLTLMCSWNRAADWLMRHTVDNKSYNFVTVCLSTLISHHSRLILRRLMVWTLRSLCVKRRCLTGSYQSKFCCLEISRPLIVYLLLYAVLFCANKCCCCCCCCCC